jgi:adenine-specific DNA-methyltransferase
MENRLVLAKQLMKDDGVIFTSIDDNEVDNLKKLEDMIFGDIDDFSYKKR